MSGRSLEDLDFPSNWDQLTEPDSVQGSLGADEKEETEESTADDAPGRDRRSQLPMINLVAAAWADLVAILAFCTVELLAVELSRYDASIAAFPWVLGLALAWWCAAASVLVVVRRGTPGMLMAGVVFRAQVSPHRLPAILVAAFFTAFLLGLPALPGPRRSLLKHAGGCDLEALEA